MRVTAALARRRATLALTGLSSLLLAGALAGARTSPDELPDIARIKITDPTRDLIRIAVPPALGSGPEATMAGEVLERDLEISGFFRVLDRRSYLANLAAEGLAMVPGDWTNIGAQWVSKARVQPAGDGAALEFRLYQPSRGADAALARSYRASSSAEARRRVHEWAAAVVKLVTNEDSFFGTRFAFASPGRRGIREVYTMDFDGHGVARLTNMRSISLLPAWAPSGGAVAFTSFARDNPDLWIISAAGGRARRVSRYPGLNTGPAWSPDGSRIALTLSKDGNAEIYVVRPGDGGIIARLTNSPRIDTSPTWSPDGAHIAFVSDRHGTPQIYVMSASGGAARRLTFQGSYNQTPKWCPRADTPLIAFTGRDERGGYDVFTVDARTAKVTRVTQGFGSNLDPTWAPNGRRLAFVNVGRRPGVWVVNPDGTNPVQVYKGGAAGLAWGPSKR